MKEHIVKPYIIHSINLPNFHSSHMQYLKYSLEFFVTGRWLMHLELLTMLFHQMHAQASQPSINKE